MQPKKKMFEEIAALEEQYVITTACNKVKILIFFLRFLLLWVNLMMNNVFLLC